MPKTKAAKKTAKKASDKGSNLKPEIVAIILVALSILLVVAFFGAGGSLTKVLLDGLRLFIGNAAYIMPAALMYLATRLFLSHKEPLSLANYAGSALVLAAVAGLFHIGVEPTAALKTAQEGDGGGMVGYLLNSSLLALFNVFTASVVLVAATLIGLVLALNLKLSDLVRKLLERRREAREEDDLAVKLGGVSSASSPKINAKVPLARSGEAAPLKEEVEVLTTNADPNWTLPSLDLLVDKQGEADAGKPQENAEIIQRTLENFGIKVQMEEINIGPTVTQYTLRPESNVKLSKITELSNNLELALAAHPIRIEAPIPGKSAVGIEVPNRRAATVRLKEILKSSEWKSRKSPLNFVLGRDIGGVAMVGDLSSMPHLLIAGATGSGKSVMINAFLMSLLYRNSPADMRLILIDPKRVELSLYNDIPHLLSPVITEPEKSVSALKWAVAEMERRYVAFSEAAKRNISEYNALKKEEGMPYIVVVIDELADLMMLAPQDVEGLIVRLAQKARATGIHLVVATQRPSVNVITGLIKANVPARIAFSTVSQVDSRTIIDQAGAEKLLGKGDMLFLAPDFVKSRRIQGVYTDEKEVKPVTDFLRGARDPQYNEEVLTQQVKIGKSAVGDIDEADDSLLMDAAQLVIESRKASASLIQRRLRVGYARAARLLDMLEDQGIVGPADGARPRDVLVSDVSEITGDADIDSEA
jgi:DNA segregation ATPase FtsK/SpoIIIE, S-DNA-T family